MVTELLSYRYPAFGRLVSGAPVTVASHGHLRTDRMDVERVSSGEILDAMHPSGVERIEQVKWGVRYPDGTIAIVPLDQPRAGSDVSDDRAVRAAACAASRSVSRQTARRLARGLRV